MQFFWNNSKVLGFKSLTGNNFPILPHSHKLTSTLNREPNNLNGYLVHKLEEVLLRNRICFKRADSSQIRRSFRYSIRRWLLYHWSWKGAWIYANWWDPISYTKLYVCSQIFPSCVSEPNRLGLFIFKSSIFNKFKIPNKFRTTIVSWWKWNNSHSSSRDVWGIY